MTEHPASPSKSEWEEFFDWPAWMDFLVFGGMAVAGLAYLTFAVWLVVSNV